MTTSKLPARPSLESLRKQAKKLARGIAAGDAGAIRRARAQLPQAELPLSQRDAQLVVAREYGFPGWQDLIKEVNQRLGKGLEHWLLARSVGLEPYVCFKAQRKPAHAIRGEAARGGRR